MIVFVFLTMRSVEALFLLPLGKQISNNSPPEGAVKSNLLALTIAVALAPLTLPAQGTQPPPKSSTPMSTSMPPPDPATSMNRDWGKVLAGGGRGDVLTGNVVLAGSALPWDPIPVNVLCDGKTRYTTYADHKGHFTIIFAEAAGSKTLQADAKPVAVQFVGCFVAARLAGFDSAPVPIASRNVLDNANLGTITLRREANTEGSALSATAAAAPKDALKVFERARSEWLDNKPDRAQHDLQKAVELDPQFAEAWFQLGKIQAAANPPEALNSFSRAVAADPKFSLPYEHMAPLTAQAGRWQDLVDLTNRALELDPRGNLELWYYNAYGNFQLGKTDAAQSSATKSLTMDPLHVEPNTEQLLAIILAQKGDLPTAIQHLRNCLTYFQSGPKLELVKEQLAQMERDNSTSK